MASNLEIYIINIHHIDIEIYTAQKRKFFIKDFFSSSFLQAFLP